MPDSTWSADQLIAQAVPVRWPACYRLVHSRFPPVAIFEAGESAEEIEIIAEIQGLTKDRVQQDLGRIDLVLPEDRLFGHGTTPVMAAFCYLSPLPSTRFSSGDFGVYYAANSVACAVTEVTYHLERFLAATREPATTTTLRCYSAAIVKPLADVRSIDELHEPGNYARSQALARELRRQGAWGLLYRSVRQSGGECVAILRPPAIRTPVVQHSHVHLQWNGERIDSWYSSSELYQIG